MQKKLGLAALAVLTAAAVTGCVEQPRKMTAQEMEAIKPYVLKTRPVISHPLDVNLENHVTLLGYDVDPETPLKPGAPFTITFYWEVKKPLDDGWLLFTHVEDAKAAPRVNADNEGVIRKHYPPGKWQQGEIIKDVQRITLPSGWDSPTATIKTGVWFGPHRLQVLTGQRDDENRVVVAVLKTTAKPREEKLALLDVPRTIGPVVVDGKLDDEAWKIAAVSPAMVAPDSGASMLPATTFRIMWDDTYIYVGYDAPDDLLHCTLTKRDEPIYDQDAVEVFLDPDGDGKDYYEFQICPAGTIFDSFLPSYRKNQNEFDAAGLLAKVVIDGTLNDEKDVDRGWTAEIAIPWKDLTSAGSVPPAIGAKWRANFFRLDDAKGGKKAWAWSAPGNNDFHNLGKFGSLTWQGLPGVPSGAAAGIETGPAAVQPPTATADPAKPAPVMLKNIPLKAGTLKLAPPPQATKPGQ